MRLISIDLYLYKPFLHHKTKHVGINDIPHVTVISGENACGKSSLLRAISPYPAVSTEFEKGGYKKAVYEHMGCYYDISSDFRKQSGVHSFKRDGIELNESGTTDVQNTLVAEYFGYDNVIERLTSGKYKICDAGRPERKALFMSTYPSSMAFVLDYYKVVSSRLRAATNNIKMLLSRKTQLEQQMISGAILEDYKKEKRDLEEAKAKIETDIYTITHSIEHVQDLLNKFDPAITSLNQDSFLSKIKNINTRFLKLLQDNKSTESFKDSELMVDRITNQEKVIQNTVKEQEDAARALKEEIDQCQKVLATDTEALIREYTNKIQVQDKIIRNTPINNYFPALSNIELDELRTNHKSILEKLELIRGSSAPYLSEFEYQEQEQKLASLKQRNNKLYFDLEQIDKELEALLRRIKSYDLHSWPSDCARPCDIKETCQNAKNSLNCELNHIRKEKEQIEKEIEENKALITNQEDVLKSKNTIRVTLRELAKFFNGVNWSPFVLDSLSFIEALNKNITQVYNKISQLLVNAENEKIVNEAKNTKQLLETKLKNLQEGDNPARQLIKESVLKKEIQLNAFIQSVTESREKLLSLDKQKYQLTKYIDIKQELDTLGRQYEIWKKYHFSQAEISYFKDLAEQLAASKIKIDEKIRELDVIIQDQDKYLIRLREEILPELAKLQKLQEELSIVEGQLNPTKGISHRYVVRYINAVFSLANQFIARVWSYPMQLDYINEDDESFDYQFKLIINETSSIKDINIASAGQKAIINLCVMLAVCIFRDYGKTYPIILDEVTVNMSLNHQNSLIQFLNELFSQNDLSQVFIVDHCIDVCSSFASIAEMVCLSRDFDIGQEWKRIGTIE